MHNILVHCSMSQVVYADCGFHNKPTIGLHIKTAYNIYVYIFYHLDVGIYADPNFALAGWSYWRHWEQTLALF